MSLLPSATELVAAILREAEPGTVSLVGRSHECDWPEDLVNDLPVLTKSKIKWTSSADVDRQVREELDAGNGLYSLDENALRDVRPDVIVTQSLCKVCSVDYCLVQAIAFNLNPTPEIVDTNPSSIEDVVDDLRRIGKGIGQQSAGEKAARRLQQRIDAASSSSLKKNLIVNTYSIPAIAFLEWTDPLFVGGHWTPQLIELAGATHPLNPCLEARGAHKSRTVSQEEFSEADPDIIIIAPCGLNLKEARAEATALEKQDWWKSLRAVQDGMVWVVDGNQMFNRPGPRLVEALEWLVSVVKKTHSLEDHGVHEFPAEQLVLAQR